jgi:rhodanese-related sulfurtransferase
MMRRIALSAIVFFFTFAAVLFAGEQKHPPIAPAAHETSAQELHSVLGRNQKILVIDVRTPAEFAHGHIPEAVNVPITVLPRKIQQMHVAKDTTIVTMCDHGGRSSRAALELQKMGYRTASFCRIDDWRKDGYKIKTGDAKPSHK